MGEVENLDGLQQIISGSDNSAWPERPDHSHPCSVFPRPASSLPRLGPTRLGYFLLLGFFAESRNLDGQRTLMAKCRWAASTRNCSGPRGSHLNLSNLVDTISNSAMKRRQALRGSARSQSGRRPVPACGEQTHRYRMAAAASRIVDRAVCVCPLTCLLPRQSSLASFTFHPFRTLDLGTLTAGLDQCESTWAKVSLCPETQWTVYQLPDVDIHIQIPRFRVGISTRSSWPACLCFLLGSDWAVPTAKWS